LGEREARGAQQEEQFTCPEQDIQQASALKIGQTLRLKADVERLSRAFFDKGAHIGQVSGLNAEPAASRIKAFKLFITTQQEVVQAESLVIQ
jgi:hypothetical protein